MEIVETDVGPNGEMEPGVSWKSRRMRVVDGDGNEIAGHNVSVWWRHYDLDAMRAHRQAERERKIEEAKAGLSPVAITARSAFLADFQRRSRRGRLGRLADDWLVTWRMTYKDPEAMSPESRVYVEEWHGEPYAPRRELTSLGELRETIAERFVSAAIWPILRAGRWLSPYDRAPRPNDLLDDAGWED